jgi:hypothetical protein
MLKSYGVFLSACLLAATPVFAGDLTLAGGQTTWHSTQCTKPNPPASVLKADRETSGNDMNALVAQHNAYVDAAQNYMNCVSNEATHDQTAVSQQIAAAAQTVIADVKGEIDSDAQALRSRQQK